MQDYLIKYQLVPNFKEVHDVDIINLIFLQTEILIKVIGFVFIEKLHSKKFINTIKSVKLD